MLGPGALGRPRGMEWGGRRVEGSGWGTHVYLWQIHFDIRQSQYNIVKVKKKKRQFYSTVTWSIQGYNMYNMYLFSFQYFMYLNTLIALHFQIMHSIHLNLYIVSLVTGHTLSWNVLST